MKLVQSIILFVAFFSIFGCNDSPYPGFTKSKSGIFYKLNQIGDSVKMPNVGDYITADIQYLTMDDSVFFKGRRKVRLMEPKTKDAIDNCFAMMSEGDNATFIISAKNFFTQTLETSLPDFFNAESNMKVNIQILEIQSAKEYELEKEAFLNWINDFGEYEKVILHQFIAEKKLEVKPNKSGLYYLQVREGTGKKVEIGDTIIINYEGKFLNGKFFDSTIRRKQPLQFVFGTEWQVVKGLEEGIAMMHEGEKTLFILPSELAFGTGGSSTGIIPPFTSLIFEVELLKVSPGQDKTEKI